MSLTAKDQGGNFKSVEPGTYIGRCIRLIDLGTQHSEYEGHEQIKKQVLIMWELPTELIEEGDHKGMPYSASRFYTLSLGEKANLRKDLEGWRGKTFTKTELEGFSLINILGHPCMLSISAKKSGGVQVTGVSKLMKGVDCPPQVNESIAFDLDEFIKGDEEMEKQFNELTDGIKKIIKESDEYKESINGFSSRGQENEEPPFNPDDDIPF